MMVASYRPYDYIVRILIIVISFVSLIFLYHNNFK